jgi:NAD(P)-dependent dehydrogenase (short-subunit alcohol dehydrogenase family)
VIATDVLAPSDEVEAIDGEGSLAYRIASVTDANDHQEIVDRCVAEFGGVDVLVNNAALTIGGWLHEFAEDDWERQLDVVLKGTFLTCKAVLPSMMEQKRGAIVNTASTVALLATHKHPAYGAAKAGVMHLSRQIALDYGPYGIRCNSVCPGPTVTPKTRNIYFDGGETPTARGKWLEETIPLGRFAEPPEIAAAITFLASDDASFITGATLFADGGHSIHIGAAAAHLF